MRPERIALWTGAALVAACFAALALVGSCANMTPDRIGLDDGKLRPCPSSPNCVSSDASDEGHAVEPLRIATSPDEAWTTLAEILRERPRTKITARTDRYLHAEVRSALFRFVDDVEFHLRPVEGIIAVRSASRVGYSDLGVNRRRVEGLRDAMRARGQLVPEGGDRGPARP
jgi:uncharacterized protein (DUF1499 family)